MSHLEERGIPVPFTGLVKISAKICNDVSVNPFYLPVTSGVSWGGIFVSEGKFGFQRLKGRIGKLRPIICDK